LLTTTTTGVCIKLKQLIERLFPRRSRQRRTEVEQEQERQKGASSWERQLMWLTNDGVRACAGSCSIVCFVPG
jgi:hypothetical protein